MPEWFIDVVTNAGPVSAVIAFMWWKADKRAEDMTKELLKALREQNKVNAAVRDVLKKEKGDDDDG